MWIDSELTAHDHVSRTCQSCFSHLRCLWSIRKLLGRDVTIQLVCTLVLSRLDYCNGVLAGLPASTLAPLQQVLHAAARLVNDLKMSDHVTSTLHWLPIKQRVDYKLCCHVHNVSIRHTPAYQPKCWPLVPTSHHFSGCGHHPAVMMSSWGRGWSLAKGRSLSLPLSHGTIFRVISRQLNALQLLNVSLKHFYSNQCIFKTDYVMHLRSTSRRRTKSHHVMLCLCLLMKSNCLQHVVLIATRYYFIPTSVNEHHNQLRPNADKTQFIGIGWMRDVLVALIWSRSMLFVTLASSSTWIIWWINMQIAMFIAAFNTSDSYSPSAHLWRLMLHIRLSASLFTAK